MSALFLTQPGTAVQIPTGQAMPLTVRLDGWGGFTGFKAIITQTGIEQQGGFQFMHTLRDFMFAYVFGERIGQAMISGIAFSQTCGNGNGLTGPEAVLQYYNRFRITRTGRPITIQIGATPAGMMRGFLTRLKLDTTDASQHLSQFSLTFAKFSADI